MPLKNKTRRCCIRIGIYKQKIVKTFCIGVHTNLIKGRENKTALF